MATTTTHTDARPAKLMLASHALCPYVQRVAIVLAEKGVPFERREVDLADKPAWFQTISPLGKTPVLVVDDLEPIFESAVICEYVDEVFAPSMHPHAALERARHRAWIAFASALLDNIAAFYNAAEDAALEAKAATLRARLETLEHALSQQGPYFDGAAFAIVDAVRAGLPLLRPVRPHRRCRLGHEPAEAVRVAPRARGTALGAISRARGLPAPARRLHRAARLGAVTAHRAAGVNDRPHRSCSGNCPRFSCRSTKLDLLWRMPGIL